jgi:nitroreductase
MNTLDAIISRRSIRQYTSQQVSDEQVATIIKAAMYAPSAVNKQPWHFIVFRDRKTVQRILEAHPNASMLQKASVAILTCWDENLQHDTGYGPIDCAAATQNMLLTAHDMGLGAVWVGLYPRQQRMEAIQGIFMLPPNIKGFSIVSLGYPAEIKISPERFNQSRIHFEQW